MTDFEKIRNKAAEEAFPEHIPGWSHVVDRRCGRDAFKMGADWTLQKFEEQMINMRKLEMERLEKVRNSLELEKIEYNEALKEEVEQLNARLIAGNNPEVSCPIIDEVIKRFPETATMMEQIRTINNQLRYNHMGIVEERDALKAERLTLVSDKYELVLERDALKAEVERSQRVRGGKGMSDLHEKVLERVKFDLSALAEPMGYHSVDIKELHSTECPALFEYAKRIAEIENARLLPIITQLLQMNEELVSALEHFKRIGDMGYEDVVLCFAEDPSNIDYAKDALCANQAQMEKLAGK